jgi:hypothetical protein
MDEFKGLDVSLEVKAGLSKNGIILDGVSISKKVNIMKSINEYFEKSCKSSEILKIDIQHMFRDQKALGSSQFSEIYDKIESLSKILSKENIILIFVKNSMLIDAYLRSNPDATSPVDAGLVFKKLAEIKCVRVVFDDVPFSDLEFSTLYDVFNVDEI